MKQIFKKKKEILQKLMNLSICNENQVKMYEDGVVRLLLPLLSHTNQDVLRWTTNCIWNILGSIKFSTNTSLSIPQVQLLFKESIEIISYFDCSKDIKEHILSFLNNLWLYTLSSSSDSEFDTFFDEDMRSKLGELSIQGDTEIRRLSSDIISKLQSISENYSQDITSSLSISEISINEETKSNSNQIEGSIVSFTFSLCF